MPAAECVLQRTKVRSHAPNLTLRFAKFSRFKSDNFHSVRNGGGPSAVALSAPFTSVPSADPLRTEFPSNCRIVATDAKLDRPCVTAGTSACPIAVTALPERPKQRWQMVEIAMEFFSQDRSPSRRIHLINFIGLPYFRLSMLILRASIDGAFDMLRRVCQEFRALEAVSGTFVADNQTSSRSIVSRGESHWHMIGNRV
jgi:hypothetical protein